MSRTAPPARGLLRQPDVERLLHGWGFSFQTVNQVDGYLRYTSLRAPRRAGIYYLTGGIALPDSVSESLILTDLIPTEITPRNAYIVLKDPQLAFYRLMQESYPQRVVRGAHATAVVDPEATISSDVYIGPYCVIESGVDIGSECHLDSHVVVKAGSKIGEGTQIESHCAIGAGGVAWVWDESGAARVVQPQTGGVHIGRDAFIGSGVIIVRGSVNEVTDIGDYVVIAPGSKIGHGCRVGRYAHLANNVTLAGNVDVEDNVFFGSGAVIRPRVTIANGVVVGAGAVVVKNIDIANVVVAGVPAKIIGERNKRLSGVPAKASD